MRTATSRTATSPPRPAVRLGSALEFLQHLWRLNHALERLSNRMERTLGVTAQQRLVIRCIGTHAGMTAGHLAALLHLDPGTVSAALRRLEQKRLLARRRDRHDRRRVTLALTAAGRALDRPSDGTVEHAVQRLLRTATRRQLESTTAVLDGLIAVLESEGR